MDKRDESSGVGLGRKELVEVEGVLDGLAVDVATAPHFARHDVAHLVGEHVEARQLSIRIGKLGVAPVPLSLLLVSVSPVEDGVGRKLLVGYGLERRAREMEGELALDVVERHVSLECVDAFVRLVDDEHVPFDFGDVLELVELPAELD